MLNASRTLSYHQKSKSHGLNKTNVEGMIEELEQFLVSKTVVGEQIQTGNNIIIGGMGAGVKPVAVLVINGDDIQMIPIKRSSGLEKLMEMVPEIIDKAHTKDNCRNDQESDKGK